jgi:hypothetical protein
VQHCVSQPPRPGSNPSLKCMGVLNVLLIKLKARKSGSVGKRWDWESDALNLAPSLYQPSCRQSPEPCHLPPSEHMKRKLPGPLL